MAGPIMDAAVLTYEGIALEVELFPRTKDPVWILGKKYNTQSDMEKLNADILTRLWFTYRKNFPAIGGTGPVSDAGWGCMLRCGQMILAQALICRHLGRDWTWLPGTTDQAYMMILRSFLDKKDSLYSIHQIAQMGVSEGKNVGQWFGPNTIAQVLKKLTMFDDWSSVAVHVAMDNTIVKEDIKNICRQCVKHRHERLEGCNGCNVMKEKSDTCQKNDYWRPVVLFIPLRLGLTEINAVYIDTLKVCFTLKQSLGVIGGKPNHAYYFIGYHGNSLIYFDPHTTQPSIDPPTMSAIPDESYHCMYPCRMNLIDLDPSIALGFYCHTEEDFDDLCQKFITRIVDRQKRPMFEVVEKRPPHWPPMENTVRPSELLDSSIRSDFTELSYESTDEQLQYDTDGEYEIV